MTGPARDWLAAKRQELNGRFRAAQRRFPRLAAEPVLALCRELLPPLAGTGEPGSAQLLASVYELILLHVGRGTLALDGGSSPAIAELLRETFPRLRRHLLARPSELPAALSNAVENLGGRGLELARGLADLGDHVRAGDDLLDAGAVLAWRLGEARLRETALEKARHLAPPVVAVALGLGTCPHDSVAKVVAGLAADAWRRPQEILAAQPAEASTGWRLAALLGNFRGFDGHFDKPPLLLNPGDKRQRHRFWVRSGEAQYRIEADVFGWVCRADTSVDYPVAKRARTVMNGANTSSVGSDGLVAFTVTDSFRVRILTQDRRPP